MSDITIPLAYRTLESPSPAKSGVRSERNPLGIWRTLVWGTAAYSAIWSLWLVEKALHALWGVQVELALLQPVAQAARVAVVAAALWWCGRSFCEYLALKPLRWPDIGRGIGYGILVYVGMCAVTILMRLLLTAFWDAGPHTGPAIGTLPLNSQTMLILLSLWIAMVVAAPITEELLYRGFIYRGLAESRLGVAGALVVTPVIFGLAHYPLNFDWTYVVATGCAGLALAWLRWRTGGTSVPIVAHVTANSIGALLLTVIILAP